MKKPRKKKYGLSFIEDKEEKQKALRKYHDSDYYKNYIREYGKRPDQWPKKRARIYLCKALKKGKITRGVCVICAEGKVQGHHRDYSKPLEVIWYCQPHHVQLHKKMKSAFQIIKNNKTLWKEKEAQ